MPFGVRLIRTASSGIRETFGKFSKVLSPGLNFYIPFIQKIGTVSHQQYQNQFKLEVKTKDNVFAHLQISVQFRIKPEDTQKYYYSLADPTKQMESYIENVVRARAPKMFLDELFESQSDISHNVSQELAAQMEQHGYYIEKTLITSIEPSAEVKIAMNKINASKRLLEAATNEAQAKYIEKVREAEADKERKRLQGEGISEQRLAILKGYEKGMDNLSKSLGLSSVQIIEFVMKTQHLDTLEAIGKSPNTKTVFMNHDPKSLENRLITVHELD